MNANRPDADTGTLTKQERKKCDLSMHGRKQKGDKRPTCDISETSFKQHNHLVDQEPLYQCNICIKSFPQRSALLRHIKTHKGERRFECDICNKSFVQKKNLVIHMRSHTGERPYKCDICDKAYKVAETLYIHKRSHTGERPFKCNICSRTFSVRGSLINHEATHTDTRPYTCTFCDKTFKHKSTLYCHEKIHTGEKRFTCHLCKKRFLWKAGLAAHVEKKHTRRKSYVRDIHPKIHTEEECLALYAKIQTEQKSSQDKNSKILGGQARFQCHLCAESFLWKQSLARHVQTHVVVVDPIKCHFCERSYKTKGGLKAHERKHLQHEPCVCDKCGKSFTEKEHLAFHTKIHTEIHTGEKQYKCATCEKSFICKENLDLHAKIHAGQRTYTFGSFNELKDGGTLDTLSRGGLNKTPFPKVISLTTHKRSEVKIDECNVHEFSKVITVKEENVEAKMDEIKTEPLDLSPKEEKHHENVSFPHTLLSAPEFSNKNVYDTNIKQEKEDLIQYNGVEEVSQPSSVVKDEVFLSDKWIVVQGSVKPEMD